MICTSHGVSSIEAIDQDFARRVDSSTSGRDGLYVKLARSLEHRISQSASASYMREPATMAHLGSVVEKTWRYTPVTRPGSQDIFSR